MFDFWQATILLFGTPLRKHKMTRYAKNMDRAMAPGNAHGCGTSVQKQHAVKRLLSYLEANLEDLLP